MPIKYSSRRFSARCVPNEAAKQSIDNDFAWGLGAGYEFLIKENVTFGGMYDRIKRSGYRDEWFNRFSAGVGYRWGYRP